MFGLYDDDWLAQDLGSISTNEGRAVVLANCLEYETDPVKLEDPSKPGVYTVLTFYLVHPGIRIPLSASVGAQQQEWIDRAQIAVLKSMRLPEEFKARVQAFAADGMTPEDAQKYRSLLIEQRSVTVNRQNFPQRFVDAGFPD